LGGRGLRDDLLRLRSHTHIYTGFTDIFSYRNKEGEVDGLCVVAKFAGVISLFFLGERGGRRRLDERGRKKGNKTRKKQKTKNRTKGSLLLPGAVSV
jgi:hypothetical protein